MEFHTQKNPAGNTGKTMEEANKGDCVTTSVACALGLPLEAVPDLSAYGSFTRGKSQTAAVLEFLREQGYGAEFFYDKQVFGRPVPKETIPTRGVAITMAYLGPYDPAIHKATTGTVCHCVLTNNGDIFWDPMGSVWGVGPVYAWIFPTKNGQRITPTKEDLERRHGKLEEDRSWRAEFAAWERAFTSLSKKFRRR